MQYMTPSRAFRTNGAPIFDPVCKRCPGTEAQRARLEEVIELAVELAREGREGRKVGTIFVFGDEEHVLANSRPMLLDPLAGHAAELRHVSLPEFRENVKELAQLDGAFVVASDGTFLSAARYIETDLGEQSLIPGLGTRHAAGMSISANTTAVAVVVSQSSVVRVFVRGEIAAEIIPELYLLSRDRFFAKGSEVRELPEHGIAIALGRGEDSPAATA